MRRLIKFECRKAFFRWPVAVLCVLLSIINILKVDNVYHEIHIWQKTRAGILPIGNYTASTRVK